MKAIKTFGFFFILFVLVSCSKSPTASTNQTESQPPVSDKNAVSGTTSTSTAVAAPSLDDQASSEALKLLTERWSVCGSNDNLLVAHQTNDLDTFDFVEMTNVTINVKSLQISDADKLNGVEWSGYVEFRAAAGRFHFLAGAKDSSNRNMKGSFPHWGKWQAEVLIGLLPTYYVKKASGQWSGSLYNYGQLLSIIEPTPCDQVPQ
jgi:hypothetical protein